MAITEGELLAAHRRLERPLFNVLYRWLWHRQDCQDLMQDAFLRVWNQREAIDAGCLDALIYRSALNLAKNLLRWRAVWRFGAASPDKVGTAAAASVLAEQRERERLLRAALRQLDRDSRNLVLLSECAGLNTAELVAVLGWPPGTIASRKHRALSRLRLELQRLGCDASALMDAEPDSSTAGECT